MQCRDPGVESPPSPLDPALHPAGRGKPTQAPGCADGREARPGPGSGPRLAAPLGGACPPGPHGFAIGGSLRPTLHRRARPRQLLLLPPPTRRSRCCGRTKWVPSSSSTVVLAFVPRQPPGCSIGLLRTYRTARSSARRTHPKIQVIPDALCGTTASSHLGGSRAGSHLCLHHPARPWFAGKRRRRPLSVMPLNRGGRTAPAPTPRDQLAQNRAIACSNPAGDEHVHDHL